MAARDRASPGVGKARRVAALVARRHDLRPPVNIRNVARQYADIEVDAIPGSADALVLDLERSPLILLRDTSNVLRQRFTIAHELGHVLLPWHGEWTMACHHELETARSMAGATDEAEANAFASELLVPTWWIDEQIARLTTANMADLLAEVAKAEVSAHVACLALAARLAPGFAFAVLDETGAIDLGGVSPGTPLRPPAKGLSFATWAARISPEHQERGRVGSRVVVWSKVKAEDREASSVTGPGSSLRSIVARHCDAQYRDETEDRVDRTIDVATAIFRSQGIRAPRERYARLRREFAARAEVPPAMLADPDFDDWLRRAASGTDLSS